MAACEACNTIPPVVTTDYTVKGAWSEIGGLQVYVTGPETATKGIVDIYDAFGPVSQILQGADLVASALNVLVIVPDFFKGNPAKEEWFFSESEEFAKIKAEFMGRALKMGENVSVLFEVLKAAKTKWPGVESWGCYGLCWGGKVTALASGSNSPFKASGQVHPGRLAKEDAEALTIPHIVLASKDEDPLVVKEYAEVLAGDGKIGEVETYGTMRHGWMGARADFKDEEVLKEYERGYNQLVKFFGKHL